MIFKLNTSAWINVINVMSMQNLSVTTYRCKWCAGNKKNRTIPLASRRLIQVDTNMIDQCSESVGTSNCNLSPRIIHPWFWNNHLSLLQNIMTFQILINTISIRKYCWPCSPIKKDIKLIKRSYFAINKNMRRDWIAFWINMELWNDWQLFWLVYFVKLNHAMCVIPKILINS